ncbi:hypothetical protein GCM10022247_43740 [Allokutzneria multivorans]|uniref:DUF3558 domain-containing protein n=1 Tax=Allokutzneria multivorans TaxID=1142134 RepID=A0ABP7ST78_9PSEU
MKRGMAAGLVACAVVLAGCAAPEPAVQSGSAPELDPNAIAYDNLDFVTTRDRVYKDERKCEGLPAGFGPKIGMSTQPISGYGAGCSFTEPWGSLTITQGPPAYRQSKQQHFSDYWNGNVYMGSGYARRMILLNRYYALMAVGKSEYGTCLVVVDTGNVEPLTFRASPPRDQAEKYQRQDQDFPVDDVVNTICPKAQQAAEKLLPLIEPNGGSRLAP